MKKEELSDDMKQRLWQQLSRIEGQVRGIKQMINCDRDCEEILIQISAINESLKSIGKKILKNHLETSVTERIKKEDAEVYDEILALFRKIG